MQTPELERKFPQYMLMNLESTTYPARTQAGEDKVWTDGRVPLVSKMVIESSVHFSASQCRFLPTCSRSLTPSQRH
jgi:hypothetical protein